MTQPRLPSNEPKRSEGFIQLTAQSCSQLASNVAGHFCWWALC